MRQIVLATGNPHKIFEMRAIFAHAGIESVDLLGLDQLGLTLHEPAEIGDTFERNATIKAISYAGQTGRPCLADDSGLIVDALGGRPGVISSHYCTDGLDTGMSRGERDALNNARVMDELTGVAAERRSARFVCVMVLAVPSLRGDNARVACRAEGVLEGRIGEDGRVPRGLHGFGYDPLFLVAPDFDRTSAELSAAEKNRRSHRAIAGARMSEEMRRCPDLTPSAG